MNRLVKKMMGNEPTYINRLKRMFLPNGFIWTLNDSAGLSALELSGVHSFNGELLPNGDFEGGVAYWDQIVGTGAIADELTLVHSGAKAAKITAGSSANTYLNSLIRVTPGSTVPLTFWTRGDGTNGGRYRVTNYHTGASIVGLTNTGITGTTYQQVIQSINVPANCPKINVNLFCPAANGGICYYDDVSIVGTVNGDGAYGLNANTTYGEPGIGNGTTCVKLAGLLGNPSGIQIGSGAFDASWNGNVGSAITWGKMDAATTWTDASTLRYLWHVKCEGDPTYFNVFGKDTVNHQLIWRRRVGGTEWNHVYTFSPAGTLDWFCMGFVWDVISTPKRFAGYLYTKSNNVWQKVFDETPGAGVGDGAWGTHPVRSDAAVLGGGLSAVQLWKGWIEYGAYIPGVVLSDSQMVSIMKL